MKIRDIKIITNLLLLAGLMACQPNDEAHHGDEAHHDDIMLTDAQFAQANIAFGKVDSVAMAEEWEVKGMIELPPQSNVSVGIPYGGFLKYTNMLPGTPVKKGQLLAVIENPEFIQFQQDYMVALANRDYLKADYERKQELFDGGVAAGKDYELAKSTYLANEAKISALAERLKLIGFDLSEVRKGKMSGKVNIYAPVSGAVREVYTNIGRYVQPQETIMSLTNDDDLHVELTVYESEIHRVKKGQVIRFTLVNQPEVIREAVVFLVGSNVREDRSVTVHGHLAKKYDDLLPGMYVSAKIAGAPKRTLAVPEEAVVRFAGKHYVFAYAGKEASAHSFEMVEVQTGASSDGFTAVYFAEETTELSKLPIVTKGAFTILAAAKNEGGGYHH